VYLDIQLNHDGVDPTPGNNSNGHTTEGDVHGTINLQISRSDLDKWLRVTIPVKDMNFREETAGWGIRENVPFNSIKDLKPEDLSFVAETKSRQAYRNTLSGDQQAQDATFNSLNIPKLYKEIAFRIKYLEISKVSSQTVNTAPTVNLNVNQNATVGVPASFEATVNDAEGDALTYDWKVDNNTVSTSARHSHIFNQAKSYDVSLSVSDGQVTTTKSVQVTVVNAGNGCKTSGTPVEMYGDLYTDGNKLKGCGAQDVQLRGMSFFWSQWSSQFYNRDVVNTLVDDWNVNAVRAAMGVDADGGYLTGDAAKQSELANIEAIIDAAIARGVYVIVDWHTHHGEDTNRNGMNVKQGAIDFFKDIATRYGNHPNIIYEIYNEPLDVTWDAVLRPYALDVIREIRAIDPDNLIIMGTQNWSQEVDDAGRNPITEYKNIAYTIHFYACTHKDSIRANVQSAINNNVVVFATEWGMSQANGGTNGTHPNTTNDNTICESETATWLNMFDANNISWFNWSLMDKEESSAALIPGASDIGNWDPNSDLSPSGKWVRNRLRSY